MWAMLHIQLSPESFIHGSFFEGRVSLITLILMAPFQILPFKDSRIHRLHNCSHQSVRENGCETCELVLKALLLSNKQTPIIPNHLAAFFLNFSQLLFNISNNLFKSSVNLSNSKIFLFFIHSNGYSFGYDSTNFSPTATTFS